MLRISKILCATFLSFSFSLCAFAEDAPVYDAGGSDNYPPAFDNSSADASPVAPEAAAPIAADPVIPEPSDDDSKAPGATSSKLSLSLEQHIELLEQKINNLQHDNPSAKFESLQTEVQSLRDQVEELDHLFMQMKEQQKLMYSDLDARLTQTMENAKKTALMTKESHTDEKPTDTTSVKIASAVPIATSEKTKKPVVSADIKPAEPIQPLNPAEEQRIYQEAYDLIKAKKYNDAIVTLQKMLHRYPSGQFAANAHYWLGELYGLVNKTDKSADEFGIVVTQFPDSAKVADAQLKIGLIYMSEFKWADAKDALKKVTTRFPGTASARLAMEQLKQIRKAGH